MRHIENSKYPFEQLVREGRITIPVPDDVPAARFRSAILSAARFHRLDTMTRIKNDAVEIVYMGKL